MIIPASAINPDRARVMFDAKIQRWLYLVAFSDYPTEALVRVGAFLCAVYDRQLALIDAARN